MLQVHSRSSSPYDWSTRSELYTEAETAQPGQRGTTRMHTQKERTHARQRRHNTTASPKLRRGAGRCCCRAAATAAAAAAAAAVLLLLHDPRCIAGHNPSQQIVSRFVFFGTHAGTSNGTAAAAAGPATGEAKMYEYTRHQAVNRLFLVLCFMERTQERVTAQQQQQQVQQQGRPKHTYEYTTRHQAG